MLGMALRLQAQEGVADEPQPTRPVKIPVLPDRLPEKPSRASVATIALEPLGFSPPNSIYMGQRYSFVSLDFLDENRLLFTFRVPGLIHRQAGEYEERQIRAMVLELPSGAVEAEALWTVHDRQRYVWMLAGGRFLLRDRESLEMGDASLELKPFLRFPGPLLALDLDPEQKFLVTNSREGAAAHQPGESSSASAAGISISEDGRKAESGSPIAVRILRRDSGKVMLVSRSPSTVHLPINSEGYLEVLRGQSDQWFLQMNYLSGGSRILGLVDSACTPSYDFLSRRELLLTTCTLAGVSKLTAITTDSKRLWEALSSDATIWPLVVKAPDGLRIAREALAVTHPVTSSAQLSQDEIKGQLVEVLDAADGKVVLETAASPILDGGGNVAISPSGRRVAVLNAGAIQLFELPAPPPLPEAPAPLSTH